MVAAVAVDVRVVDGGTGDLDDVGVLFREMVAHHRHVVADAWPVRAAEDAWTRRRREYEAWLPDGARLLLARTDGDPHAVGYAMVRVHEAGATWNIGDRVCELESLSVSERVRGQGVGTVLLDAARGVCREAGVSHWLVAVVEANADAIRFYERAGFRPYYRNLLAEL